jgi:hypothetical protein
VADIDAEVEYALLIDDVYVPHYHRMPLRIGGPWAIYGVPHGVDREATPFIEWIEAALRLFSAAHYIYAGGVQMLKITMGARGLGSVGMAGRSTAVRTQGGVSVRLLGVEVVACWA